MLMAQNFAPQGAPWCDERFHHVSDRVSDRGRTTLATYDPTEIEDIGGAGPDGQSCFALCPPGPIGSHGLVVVTVGFVDVLGWGMTRGVRLEWRRWARYDRPGRCAG